MTRATLTILLCLCLAACLPALGQTTTPAPTGKFGLAVTKPATAAPSAPSPSATSALVPAAATSTSAATPPASAPPPAQGTSVMGPIKNILNGNNIKTVYATATGTVQGQIGGGTIQCTKYQFQPTKPLDANTGLPTGRMKAGPITITKRWDASSAGLLQALATNETLKTVTLQFTSVSLDGKQVVAATATMTNAIVASVNQYVDSTGALEDVSFTFQKIDIAYPLDRGSFSWSGSQQ